MPVKEQGLYISVLFLVNTPVLRLKSCILTLPLKPLRAGPTGLFVICECYGNV